MNSVNPEMQPVQIASRAAHARRHRVLIVEDDRDAAEIMKLLLEFSGFEIRVAYSGESALMVAPSFLPGIILSDIGLRPGMDGYRLARELRQLELLRGVYLIALTGFGRREDLARTRAAGYDLHLIKPVAPDELEALLQRLLKS